MANIRHGAYKLAREVKQGLLPDKRTTLGAILAEIETRMHEHYGNLNGPQAVLFNTTILPHIAFLLKHPMVDEKTGELMSDWCWTSTRVENSLKTLHSLAGKAHEAPPIQLSDYIEQLEDKPETKTD
jgi:hypothetical protein